MYHAFVVELQIGLIHKKTKCFDGIVFFRSCQRNDWHSKHRTQCKASPNVAGCPFIISVPQSGATYERITQMMEVYARYGT